MNVPIGYMYFTMSLLVMPIKRSSMYTYMCIHVCYMYIINYNFAGDLLPKVEMCMLFF